MSPVPPQYDNEQIATIHTDELEKRRQPATPATWALAVLLVAAAVAWVVLAVIRSHHTSEAPYPLTATTAAPRSAAPAR